jgi:hypothetical protein
MKIIQYVKARIPRIITRVLGFILVMIALLLTLTIAYAEHPFPAIYDLIFTAVFIVTMFTVGAIAFMGYWFKSKSFPFN